MGVFNLTYLSDLNSEKENSKENSIQYEDKIDRLQEKLTDAAKARDLYLLWANTLAQEIAGDEDIGENRDGNNPWENALRILRLNHEDEYE